MNHRFILRCIALAALVLSAAGCMHEPPPPEDLVTDGTFKAEGTSDAMVVVSAPRLIAYDAALEVKGSITRQPGVNGPIPGRLELTVVSPAGTLLERLPLSWTPAEIPLTGSRASAYLLRYGELPPAGSTVRVRHVTPAVASP